jgi:membrane fusion protein (multidrug efflux system)
MKKSQKILLYISIPALLAVSLIVYNSFIRKSDIKLNAPMGSAPASAQQGGQGGGRSLPVSVYIAEKMEREDGSVRIGNLVAKERVEIVSELSGRVIQINFREGQHVKKGDILVKLNDDELQVQLTKAEYQHTLLEQRLERQRILLEKDAVSREDYDKVLTEYNVLKQDIEQLKIRIEKMHVRAPFDGVLGFRDISLGAFLQPNSKISTLVDIATLIVEVAIPEKYITDRLFGNEILFNVEGMSRDFRASVYAIDPQIEVKTRTIMIRARYDNKTGLLRPGMSARVSLNTGAGEKNLYVPNQAVVPDVRGRSVWVMKNNKATLIPVQTGTRTVDMLEILSGIELGDTIITTGLMQLREGLTVVPVNI